MKPSEYFFKKRIENQRWYDSDEANESTIRELDTHFINKEELKEQIEHILKYEIDASFPSSKDFKNFIEKILKLLE